MSSRLTWRMTISSPPASIMYLGGNGGIGLSIGRRIFSTSTAINSPGVAGSGLHRSRRVTGFSDHAGSLGSQRAADKQNPLPCLRWNRASGWPGATALPTGCLREATKEFRWGYEKISKYFPWDQGPVTASLPSRNRDSARSPHLSIRRMNLGSVHPTLSSFPSWPGQSIS